MIEDWILPFISTTCISHTVPKTNVHGALLFTVYATTLSSEVKSQFETAH